MGKFLIPSGGQRVQQLLLNEWFDFSAVGVYRIKITLLPPFFTETPTNADRPASEFSVEIKPRDPGKLKRVAKELADMAIAAPTLEESMNAANALSFIRDPLAVDDLIRVLQEGSLVEHYAVAGLGRIGNAEAVAALEAASQSHPDGEVREAARSALRLLRSE